MRKITQKACDAFFGGYDWKSGNNQVIVEGETTYLLLYSKILAERMPGKCIIYNIGLTTTVKERLNGVLSYFWAKVFTKKFKDYLELPELTIEWDGTPFDLICQKFVLPENVENMAGLRQAIGDNKWGLAQNLVHNLNDEVASDYLNLHKKDKKDKKDKKKIKSNKDCYQTYSLYKTRHNAASNKGKRK